MRAALLQKLEEKKNRVIQKVIFLIREKEGQIENFKFLYNRGERTKIIYIKNMCFNQKMNSLLKALILRRRIKYEFA